MATYRGFIRSIETRDDGWVECGLRSVHASNQDRAFLIQSLDGDLEKVNRRLAKLGLLRDALARTLPVEIQYTTEDDRGDLIEDVTVYPRPSFDGRRASRTIRGTVLGLSITERGPESGGSPYVDEADVAGATILTSTGNVEGVLVDLQRPDPMTAHAILGLLRDAHSTRRPVEVMVTSEIGKEATAASREETGFDIPPGYVQTCRWVPVPDDDLDYVFAFVERLEQRWESYAASDPAAVAHIEVVYTTAPGQTPEGDVSDNGIFTPETRSARLHASSPLVERLRDALRDSLQVKLGMGEDGLIHAVEVVSHLGSAARPIWIEIDQRAMCTPEQEGLCDNVPTIQTPSASHLNQTPYTVGWTGQGFFHEGIWRFVVAADGPVDLMIDGEQPCDRGNDGHGDEVGDASAPVDDLEMALDDPASGRTPFFGGSAARSGPSAPRPRQITIHAYMNGLHQIDLQVSDRVCRSPFRFLVYRLR